MKKTKLLALALSLFLTSAATAQHISVVHTYSGPANSSVMDDYMGYKAIKTSATGFSIVARDNAFTENSIFTGTIPSGDIMDMKLNVRLMDKSIVLAIITSGSVYLKSLTPIGTTYTESGTTFNAATGTSFQSITASRSPHGQGFLIRSIDGSSNVTTTGGKNNYNGAYVSSVGVSEPGGTYYAIQSDNDYHYWVYKIPYGVQLERRNDDNILSLNNQFIPYAGSDLTVTHTSQDEFGLNIMIRDGGGNLVRKRMFKAGFMTDYSATMNYAIGSNADGDAAMFLSRAVMMFGGTMVRTNDSWTGTLTPTNSVSFGNGYNKFRAYPIGDNYFIWYAHGTDGKTKMLLGSMLTLSRPDSLMLQDGTDNVVTGFYRENDTTAVAFGYSIISGVMTAKEWVIRTPFDKTLGIVNLKPEALTLNVYPNPTTGIIHLDNIEYVKEVSIMNLMGQQVMNLPTPGKNATIDISALPPGMYILTGYDEIQAYQQKIIKQ